MTKIRLLRMQNLDSISDKYLTSLQESQPHKPYQSLKSAQTYSIKQRIQMLQTSLNVSKKPVNRQFLLG